MIAEAELGDEVDIHVSEGAIIITSMKKPRAGWAESARLMHDRKDDRLMDLPDDTRFDRTEWDW